MSKKIIILLFFLSLLLISPVYALNTDFTNTEIAYEEGSIQFSDFPEMYSPAYTEFALTFDTTIYNSPPRSLKLTWGDRPTENPRPAITVFDVPNEFWVEEHIYIPADYVLKRWQLLCEPFTGKWADLGLSQNSDVIRRLCILYLSGDYNDGTGSIYLSAEIDEGRYPEDWTTAYNSGELPLVKRGEWHELRYHIKIAQAGQVEVWWKAESDSSFYKLVDYNGDTRSTTGRNDFVPIDHYKRTDEPTTSIYLDDLRMETYAFFSEPEPETNVTSSPMRADIYIEHTYQRDLIIDIGVGDPSSPVWSQRVWDHEGDSSDDVDLTVDLSSADAYLPPDGDQWFIKVYDTANGDLGQITEFSLTYDGSTYTSTDLPVPVNDQQISYAYIQSGSYTPDAYADIYIEHTYRGDLIVDLEARDYISGETWSQRIWNGEGSNVDNLNLRVDLSSATAWLSPSPFKQWTLSVYDRYNGDQGQIIAFSIIHDGTTYIETDTPIPINDFETSTAVVSS